MSKPSKSNNKKNDDSKSKTKDVIIHSEKKAPRRNLNECVGFIYGGSLIKASHAYLFTVPDKDVVGYVRENLTKYFGNNVTGRYVKCANAEDTLRRIIESAEERKYLAESSDVCILKCSVNNASALLKEISECSTANSFKLANDEDKPKKKTIKNAKKSSDEEDGEKGILTKMVTMFYRMHKIV